MNKLLLSVVALATLSLVSVVSAKSSNGDGKYQKVEHYCGSCSQQKQHCKCAHEVCEKIVPAVETAPLREVCEDQSYCEENTQERINSRGEKECFKVIAHDKIVKPVCRRVCSKVCPPEYKEVTVSGHGNGKNVHPEKSKTAKNKAKTPKKETIVITDEIM